MFVERALRPIDRIEVGDSALELFSGDLLDLAVQGVGCYASSSLTLRSAIGMRIVARGGPAVRCDAGKYAPATVGQALAISAGRLPMHHVLVAVTNTPTTPPNLASVRTAVSAVLARAAALELESLAIPLLHAGRRIADDDLLVITLSALFEHLCGYTPIKRLYLVVDEEDEPACAAVLRVRTLLSTLAGVGACWAQATLAANARATVAEHSCASHRMLAELDTERRQSLTAIVQALSPLVAAPSTPGRLGLDAELARCHTALAQPDLLMPPLARAVGG